MATNSVFYVFTVVEKSKGKVVTNTLAGTPMTSITFISFAILPYTLEKGAFYLNVLSLAIHLSSNLVLFLLVFYSNP